MGTWPNCPTLIQTAFHNKWGQMITFKKKKKKRNDEINISICYILTLKTTTKNIGEKLYVIHSNLSNDISFSETRFVNYLFINVFILSPTSKKQIFKE